MSPETKRSQLAAGLFPIVLFSSGITFLLTSDNLTLLMPFHTLTQISSEWPCTWHHNPCSGSVSVSLNLLTLVLIVHVWLADENKTVNFLQLSQLPICVHLSVFFLLDHRPFRNLSLSPGCRCLIQVFLIWIIIPQETAACSLLSSLPSLCMCTVIYALPVEQHLKLLNALLDPYS